MRIRGGGGGIANETSILREQVSRDFSLPSYKKWVGFVGVGIGGFAAFLWERTRFQVSQEEGFWQSWDLRMGILSILSTRILKIHELGLFLGGLDCDTSDGRVVYGARLGSGRSVLVSRRWQNILRASS